MLDRPDVESPVFDLIDIAYSYDGQNLALDDVSLQVLRGERLAILGSNGSGKSTLLKILDGLVFPGSGSVRAFGQPLTEDALKNDDSNFAFRSRVAFVFQESDAQLFMPSVWDEIAFGPLQMDVNQAEVEARVEHVLRTLQIESLRERAPHQLSGGEKRKVALGSVLSLTPEVWLLDEPTSGLDPRTVSWLVDFLDSEPLAENTIIVGTHDLELASAIANRACLLDERHRVAAEGPIAELLSDHDLLAEVNLVR